MLEGQLRALQELLRTAIARRDWEATTRAAEILDEQVVAATIDAQEYGVALGAVMEQLRGGMLDLMRLRYAGPRDCDERTASEIAELRALMSLKEAVRTSRCSSEGARD